MKILCYGNKVNVPFQFSKMCWQRGIDAALWLPNNSRYWKSDPRWQEPDAYETYRDHIICSDMRKVHLAFPSQTVRQLASEVDVVVTSGEYIVGALALKKPVVIFAAGSDVRVWPFQFGPGVQKAVFAFLYRKRSRNISAVVAAHERTLASARRLGVGKVIGLSAPVDMEGFERFRDKELAERLTWKYKDYERIFLLFSRKNMDPLHDEYKGSEIFLNAFQRFVATKHAQRTKVISVRSGFDQHKFEREVNNRGLQKWFEYIDHMPLPKLHAYMSLPTAIAFDQFGVGIAAMGGIAREALALGCPVVSGTLTASEGFIASHGPECPLITAIDEKEVYHAMVMFADMSKESFGNLKMRSVEWTRRHISWEVLFERYIEVVRAASTGDQEEGLKWIRNLGLGG